MTRRRVVALAQALTMSLLLLPGPFSTGPAMVEAARQPVEFDPATIYDAEGKGIGCRGGAKKCKGPGLPKDPPWPPGAAPTPSPEPSPSPELSAEATLEDVPSEPPADVEPEPEAAAMRFVAAQEVATVQAEPPVKLRPKSKLLTGIDVSHHNGDIDYRAVKQAGHRFVFIKATQDNDFIDPMFPTNIARARAVGLSAGAYHFFDYTLDGREQADHFIDRVEAAGGVDDALPPVVDVECWAPIGPSIHAVSAARLRDFVERVYERTGVLPLVYTSVFMWREVVGNAEGFEDLPLWAACWGCDRPISIAPGWTDWAFWQEGLTRIPGVGRLDGNYFDGSRKELKALETRPFSIAGGAAASAGGTVELDLGGRIGTHIRTSPDGETWTEWQRLSGTPTVVIGEEEGSYTVFAQLRNGGGLRSPVFSDSIVVDATPPEISEPSVWLRTGPLGTGGASVPVTVRWEARDEGAGLTDARVVVRCGEGEKQRTKAPGRAEPGELAAWAAEAWLFPGAACDVTAVARDAAGVAVRATASGAQAQVVAASSAGAVEADEIGVIARRGPDGGRAALLVDGDSVALMDLYAPEASGPEVVHVIALPPGQYALAVEATGSSDPASAGAVVEVEGFATLSR